LGSDELFSRIQRSLNAAIQRRVKRDIDSLRQQAATLDPLSMDNADSWQDIFLACEKMTDRLSHLGSYIGCLSAADARNEVYSREEADFSRIEAESEKLDVELLRALKNTSDEVFLHFSARPALQDAAHFLRRQRE
jgi:oligoendopeptidase F